jgi:hypothetical protein
MLVRKEKHAPHARRGHPHPAQVGTVVSELAVGRSVSPHSSRRGDVRPGLLTGARDCRNTASRPRAVVNSSWERFSRARSRIRSIAAPRRTQERIAARSMMFGMSKGRLTSRSGRRSRWTARAARRCARSRPGSGAARRRSRGSLPATGSTAAGIGRPARTPLAYDRASRAQAAPAFGCSSRLRVRGAGVPTQRLKAWMISPGTHPVHMRTENSPVRPTLANTKIPGK